MIPNNIVALGALVSLATAVPMQQQKREVVWEQETTVVYTTVPVTVTHWLEPGQSAPPQHYGHHKHHSTSDPDSEPSAAQPSSAGPSDQTYPTESSVVEAVAPTSTTSKSTYVAPTTTSTTEAAQSTAAAAEPSSYQAGSSDSSGDNGLTGIAASGESYSGDFTYYTPGLGSCGWTNTESEDIVAISHVIFDTYDTGNPNNNPLCGQTLTITGKDGSSYSAKIVDRCPGCDIGSLDLTQPFFNEVTNNGDGRVSGMKWKFD